MVIFRIAKLKNIDTDPPEQYRQPPHHHHHHKGSVNSDLTYKWIDYKGDYFNIPTATF